MSSGVRSDAGARPDEFDRVEHSRAAIGRLG